MKIKMIYRDGKKYGIQYVEITDEEANLWVTYDYEQRLSEAPEAEKMNIQKRTPQEIADELNRQEERINKANMRERAKYASQTVLDSNGKEVNRMDLIPDKETPSPLELCIASEEQEEKTQKVHASKELIYS